MKTITEIRKAFWESFPEFKNQYRASYRQNQYKCDVRCSFVSFVDSLRKDNTISEKLCNRATL